MVEKRPSAVGDSASDGQRHKRQTTGSDRTIQSLDVTVSPTSQSPAVQAPLLPAYSTSTSTSPRALLPAAVPPPILVFSGKFQVLEPDNEQIVTPVKRDAQGTSWRVIWQPRSLTDHSFVGVFVELVTDAREHQNVLPRLAEVGIALLHQRGRASVVKHTSVHAFSKDTPMFGMSQFCLRSDLLNPCNHFLTTGGKVEIEVQLTFVADTADVEMEIEENVHASMVSSRQDGAWTNDSQSMQDLHSYDSKEETEMVGLKNQGATCYLNSLLQTLFHLRAFRQMVYETPTAQEDTNNSVSLALQRVFHRLQSQQKVVSTKELTRSFGWSAIDSFMQHDVQELYRILCDRLEEKMKHTKVDSAISKLFEGTVRSFVQCVNVDFQSFRDESFYDLQLDVKGCKDLMQSFRKYVEVEMLDGDNQYDAEGHGKQDAKKGIEFASFPPVLNIQLKRFEYDAMRDGMVKVHDRFEFPKVLVLDEFIAHSSATKDTNEKSPRYVYHLHSVLVHSGDVHGGHYYVFIRPGKHTSTSTSWFKFDDDQITRVDERIAIEGNYGSAGTPVTPQGGSTEPPSPMCSSSIFGEPGTGGGSATDEGYEYSQCNDTSSVPLRPSSSTQMLPLGRSFSSAYMLVYVRNGENDISAIQEGAFVNTGSITTTPCASKEISGADHLPNNIKTEVPPIKPEIRTWESDPVPIPTELVTRFHEEEKAVSRRKKAQQTEHLYTNLRIASDTSIAKLRRITKTMDFSGFNNSNTLRIRIKRTASIRQLYRRVCKETGVPMLRQRLWKVITRENRTTRPDQPLACWNLPHRRHPPPSMLLK
uniref:Ubiquitin carboxyl-terminal hydrolase n=1 Tax=Hyaloperonospora arabidopsidis (strain Emoy2) TaxID=559515 RepID=M4B5H9_HYAAE